MKSFLNISALCFLILLSQAAYSAGAIGYVPGEVLIRYKKNMTVAGAFNRLQEDRLILAGKLGKTKNQNQPEIFHARLAGNESVAEAIKRLQQNSNVESVQPNFKYKILGETVPNDPHYGLQWSLRNTQQNIVNIDLAGPDFPSSEGIPAIYGKDMNLPVAWDLIHDCNVVVAVVDSGIRYDHEDLVANMWDGSAAGTTKHGWNTLNDTTDPMDDNGHGTHVAGTIGAVGNNAKGTTGICWSVKLMAIKAMSAAGTGTTLSISKGIRKAVDNDAKVINLSVGGADADPIMLTEIQYARDKDVVVISAAGNDGTNNTSAPMYPCNHRDVNTVCVAAMGQDFRLASFSNYSTKFVDVGAPGINILSTWFESRATTPISFASGWNNPNPAAGSAWGAQSPTLGGVVVDAMTVPANWNLVEKYVDNSDARIDQSFSFPTATSVWFQRKMLNNLETGDYVRTFIKNGNTDPFVGTLLESISNKTGSTSYLNIFNVSDECAKSDCSIGFQFTSNAEGVNTGVAIHSMKMVAFSPGTTGYNILRGTSMATPHVAGLAALLIARNPKYTAADVVYSIKNGGISTIHLSNKTTTGKTVTATGSLAFIRPPTGVMAVQIQ